jgi:hypothetical protein
MKPGDKIKADTSAELGEIARHTNQNVLPRVDTDPVALLPHCSGCRITVFHFSGAARRISLK